MIDLDKAILEHHSTRMFLPNQPVPRQLVDEALNRAASAVELQHPAVACRVRVRTARRDRLVAALLDEPSRGSPKIPPLPETFRHYRREQDAGLPGSLCERRPSFRIPALAGMPGSP